MDIQLMDSQLTVSVTRDRVFTRTSQQASKSIGMCTYYSVLQALLCSSVELLQNILLGTRGVQDSDFRTRIQQDSTYFE